MLVHFFRRELRLPCVNPSICECANQEEDALRDETVFCRGLPQPLASYRFNTFILIALGETLLRQGLPLEGGTIYLC